MKYFSTGIKTKVGKWDYKSWQVIWLGALYDRWCPGGSPSRPGLRHQSALALSVLGHGSGECSNTLCPRGVGLESDLGKGQLRQYHQCVHHLEVLTHSSHISHTAMHQRELLWSYPDTSQGDSFFFLLEHGGLQGQPSLIITHPPINWSCWRMLRAVHV